MMAFGKVVAVVVLQGWEEIEPPGSPFWLWLQDVLSVFRFLTPPFSFMVKQFAEAPNTKD